MASSISKIGLGQQPITPQNNIDLYSFDGVKRKSNAVIDELFSTAVCFSHADQKALILSLDLIWVDRLFVEDMKKLLSKIGFHPDLTLICTTHSHSTPQIMEDCFNIGRPDSTYRAYLKDQSLRAAEQALEDMREGFIKFGSSRPKGLTVNRRKRILDIDKLKRGKIKTKIANRPNFNKPCDDLLSAAWLVDKNNNPRGVILNFACHPTLYRGNAVSSDFPGKVALNLKKYFGPDFVTCFLQGFSGNIKASLVEKSMGTANGILKKIYHSIFDSVLFKKELTQEEIDDFANGIVDQVRNLTDGEPREIALSGQTAQINLPLESPRDQAYFLEMSRESDWSRSTYAKAMLRQKDKFDSKPFCIQLVSLCSDLDILAVEGEIFNEYAHWLHEKFAEKSHNVMPVACSGGMVGYIADSEGILQGGYETDRSLVEFGLPSRFSIKIENMIKEKILDLLSRE